MKKIIPKYLIPKMTTLYSTLVGIKFRPVKASVKNDSCHLQICFLYTCTMRTLLKHMHYTSRTHVNYTLSQLHYILPTSAYFNLRYISTNQSEHLSSSPLHQRVSHSLSRKRCPSICTPANLTPVIMYAPAHYIHHTC